MGSGGERGEILGEASAIDAHYDEGVWQEAVGLLEGAYVFVSSGWSVWPSWHSVGVDLTSKRPRAPALNFTHLELAMVRHASVTSQLCGRTASQTRIILQS